MRGRCSRPRKLQANNRPVQTQQTYQMNQTAQTRQTATDHEVTRYVMIATNFISKSSLVTVFGSLGILQVLSS